MDNVFEMLREMIPMIDAARFYGLSVDRSGMSCCPFHDDKTPSLKIYDDHFYCFGCGNHGDVTGFVAKLFGISQIEAVKKLSYDFGLNLFEKGIAAHINKKVDPEVEYNRWLSSAKQTLSDYLNQLCRWKREYSPQGSDEPLNSLFVESLQRTECVKFMYDVLRHGSDKEKRDLYKYGKADIEAIEMRMKKLAYVKRVQKKRVM